MRRAILTSCLFLVVLVLVPVTRGVHAAREPIVVIAHRSFKANTVHVNELRAVFLRQSTQLAGQRVIPLTYVTGHPLRIQFDERVLGMSEAEIGRYWVDARIRGLGLPPRSASSPQLIVRSVIALPGAIGYAPKSLASGQPLKVLQLDGLSSPL